MAKTADRIKERIEIVDLPEDTFETKKSKSWLVILVVLVAAAAFGFFQLRRFVNNDD